MASQVGVAEVAVVPTFKGFRRKVTAETDGSAQQASSGFSRIFSKTGTDSGKAAGSGFKRAFEGSAQGASSKVTKALEGDVAKASRALSAARLKEQDAAGKSRVAEKQLAEARKKYADDSSQVVRAQERMESSSRQLKQAHERTEEATDDLKKAQGELARAADRAGDELQDAGGRGVTGFRSNVVGGVKGFAGPLITAFAALGIGRIVMGAFDDAKNFVLGAIQLASDMEQSVGGVDAVFKDQADTIHAWGQEAAQSVGLSRSKYNEFATVVGAQLKNLGIPMENLSGQTNDLVGLGADLAAQFGGPTSDAVGALSSLLRGESNPIERYGVSINQARIEAKLLEMGLGGLEGAQKDEAKLQATLALLYEQTADAQGAFGREADTLAGKQQRNAAAWENASTRIGEAFMPIALQLSDILANDIIPVISEMVEEHGPALAEAFEEIAPALRDLAEDLLPQLPGLFKSVADSLPAVISFMESAAPVVADVVGGLADLLNATDAYLSLVAGDTNIQEFMETILGLESPIGKALGWVAGFANGVGQFLGQARVGAQVAIDGIVGFITGLPQRAKDALGDIGNTLKGSGKALMDGFLKGIESMFRPIGDAVSGALTWVKGFFPQSPAKRGPFSGSGWTDLKRSGGATWDQWLGGMGGGEPPFPGFPGSPGGPSAPGAGAAAMVGVFVQNPFTGEYLISKVDDRADVRAAARGGQVSSAIRNRRWADA